MEDLYDQMFTPQPTILTHFDAKTGSHHDQKLLDKGQSLKYRQNHGTNRTAPVGGIILLGSSAFMWPFTKKKIEDIDKKRFQAFGELAVVSSLCIGPHRIPVMHGKRETPNHVSDSGWLLSSGQETPQFLADSNNYKLVPFERMIAAEPTLAPLRDFPIGSEVTRNLVTESWRFIVGDKVIDDEGKKVGRIR